jgi:hypothetical protein
VCVRERMNNSTRNFFLCCGKSIWGSKQVSTLLSNNQLFVACAHSYMLWHRFLKLLVCIFIVCLCMTTLTEVFPCFFLSRKANARVKPRKDEARPALFLVVVLFHVFFVLFYVFLCCSVYCLFCDVPCIVCVYMCTEQLPPSGYPIAVKYKYIVSVYCKAQCLLSLNVSGV